MRYTHELGKIQFKKLNDAISAAEWKGRTTTEKTAFINGHGEREEHESTTTALFSTIDPLITDFLNITLKSREPITPDNLHDTISAITAFTASYTVPVVDRRKSLEQLQQERAIMNAERDDEERRREEQERETHAAGMLTQSDKIKLGIKEIAARVREQLKKEFITASFSVTIERYSGGSSLHVALMSYAGGPIISPPNELTAERVGRYIDQWRTLESLRAEQVKHYHQLNATFSGDYDPERWTNGVFLTAEGYNLFKRVSEIIALYNYDNSDSQADYFDVNFYTHLNIGRYDKPFKQLPPPATVTTTEENTPPPIVAGVVVRHNIPKDGLEIVFPAKPSPRVLEALKSRGFRWSNYGGLWYKRYSAALEQEIKGVLGATL